MSFDWGGDERCLLKVWRVRENFVLEREEERKSEQSREQIFRHYYWVQLAPSSIRSFRNDVRFIIIISPCFCSIEIMEIEHVFSAGFHFFCALLFSFSLLHAERLLHRERKLEISILHSTFLNDEFLILLNHQENPKRWGKEEAERDFVAKKRFWDRIMIAEMWDTQRRLSVRSDVLWMSEKKGKERLGGHSTFTQRLHTNKQHTSPQSDSHIYSLWGMKQNACLNSSNSIIRISLVFSKKKSFT